MTEPMSVMTFRRGDTTAQELQQIVDEVLAELSEPDSEAVRSARAAGVKPQDLTGPRYRSWRASSGPSRY